MDILTLAMLMRVLSQIFMQDPRDFSATKLSFLPEMTKIVRRLSNKLKLKARILWYISMKWEISESKYEMIYRFLTQTLLEPPNPSTKH
jgi:hypothetical protein